MNKDINILRFIEERADQDTIESVNAWAKENAQNLHDYRLVWNNLEGLNRIEIDDVSEAWNEFNMLIQESSSEESSNLESTLGIQQSNLKITESNSINSKAVKQMTWWKIGTIAASILFVTALIFLNKDTIIKPVIVESGKEKKKFYLPDSSLVILAPNSSVGFLNNFEKSTQRDIALKGHATFDVMKDSSKPFVVGAGKVAIKAVGTIFSVEFSSDEVVVENIEGVVKFYEKENEEQAVTIEEGESYSYNEGIFKSTTVLEIIPAPKSLPADKPVNGVHTIREVINYMNFITHGTTKVVGDNIEYDEKINIELDTYIPEELLKRIYKEAKIKIKKTKKCEFCFEITSFTKR